MVSFENALDTAKSRIARWNDFAGLDEVNLVRDAKGMISVYLVFLQLGIMVLTIIPTEFLLHKHFTKQGMKK